VISDKINVPDKNIRSVFKEFFFNITYL